MVSRRLLRNLLNHRVPLPAPTAAAWDAMDRQEWGELRPLLHPSVEFTDRAVEVRGRSQLLAHLKDQPTPKPPTDVEVRDGQVVRWTR